MTPLKWAALIGGVVLLIGGVGLFLVVRMVMGHLQTTRSTTPNVTANTPSTPNTNTNSNTPPEPAPAPAPAPTDESLGVLAVQLPKQVSPARMRITVFRGDTVALAMSADGKPLNSMKPVDLGKRQLNPGSYRLQFIYRDEKIPPVTVDVHAGEPTSVKPPLRELAQIEYEHGQATSSDIQHYKRTVELDPNHVDARLDLAAYYIQKDQWDEVKTQLKALRRLAPDNADVKRIQEIVAAHDKKEQGGT